ncbi:ATP-dependent RNA helicase RhlE [Geomonas silvestris]|uniref:ATP-dependent RNA helicase RhlE n=1 Tax=Geomonas silvestris TaxID=2740184 RepID=A0A6V8MGC0_9BACT|nr:DEAD/DEAH box helicase [Geomonas silvestris]GFO58992.1 ATP-dependent RNA helicase RhlE [Geomonas silvestris]
MPFEALNLAPPLVKAIAACGYTAPTPIQAESIPLALAGKDLIGSAQTGTGKTASFVLPALQRLLTPSQKPGKGPRILVLTPTRELATQVNDAVRNYGKFMRVRCGSILGGMPYRDQMMLLAQPVDIIVATPGRLIDHLDRRSLNFSRLELLVLDEADRMLDMGFSDDVDRIAAAAPEDRQTLLFTATMDDAMAKLAKRLLTDPVRIAVEPKELAQPKIEQRLHVTDDMRHKNRLLQHLVNDASVTKAIIFSATKRDADQLAAELYAQGHAAAALHGDMSQGARNRTIVNMRRGKVRLLVATDVAARGLDVSGISHVINFDLPKFAEDYVHRIGRTGRAGATGVAISFCSTNEVAYLDRIERYTGKTLPQSVIPGLEPSRPLRRAGGAPGARKPRPGAPGKKPFAGSKRPFGPGNGASRRDAQVQVEYRRGRGGAPK